MGTMEYIQLRDSLLMKLLKTKDVKLLKKIEELFNNSGEDFFDELPEHVQNDLLVSIEQSKNNETISFDEMIKELE